VRRGGPLRALFAKELRDLSRNAGALVPVALVTVIALVLPFVVAVAVPAATGERLADDGDLLRLSEAAGADPALEPDARVQYFLFQQFLLLFLLTPITGAMALAAHSVVGEKQARTLEPLLATPITTFELLAAKVAGALAPTLAVSLAGLALYAAGLATFALPGVAGAMANARTAALVLLVGPAAALVALQGALIVSSRVNDARTAQQFGALIIVPIAVVMIAQFSGAFWLTAGGLALAAAGLLALWAALALASVALFRRESILTRWR
jgi:ABC-2 type transport system permease protein